jgi:sulfide:quinone oxidoreductase
MLGSGLAALEAAFLLDTRLSGRVDLRLVCEHGDFVLRPNLVYVPFGADPAALGLRIIELLDRTGIAHEPDRVEGVDTDAGRVQLARGGQLAYEHLMIATGATTRPQEIPGLHEHAVSIWDCSGILTLRERLAPLRGQAREGVRRRVLFVGPPRNEYSLPLYEVALILDTWLRRECAREQVDIGFITNEESFLEACGPRMHEVIEREFAERSIDAHAGERLTGVRPHEASFAGGRGESFDLLVTIPPHTPSIRYDGLAVDDRGFLRVDSDTRRVVGHPELYAPGDSGDFPLKDPFLALLEADAVADHVAAVVTAAVAAVVTAQAPVRRSLIDMLDRAAFAQLPLELTGDPDHPVRPRSGAEAEYKVGVSPLWRMGKRMLASYLLMRFAAGEPFHAGAGWRLMSVAMRAMAGMLAE